MKNFKIFLLIVSTLVFVGGACGKIKTIPTPKAPVNITLASATETSLTFQWSSVKDASSYEWHLSYTDPISGLGGAKSGSTMTNDVTIEGLYPGTRHTLQLRTVAFGLLSEWSESVEAMTQGNPPSIYYDKFKIPAHEEDNVARAFPGAEGGGMYTTGGRGGDVYHVTNLEDSGEGSLRWAVGKSGKRTIVFDVAGIIELKSDLKITNGDVTIAGQTAPGDGICLKNYTTFVDADNVIIRYLRFRLGEGGDQSKAEDACWGRRHDNIILDHCSMSWSIDECASFYENEFFTMQWCILSESLNKSSHPKGNHGYGGIWGGKNASFHHNLLANHNNRTPRFDHPQIYENPSNPARRGYVDYRNCVNYNWGSGDGCYGGNGSYINMVNNYYKPGKASANRKFILAQGLYKQDNGAYATYQYPYIYISGNVHTGNETITKDNAAGIDWDISTNPTTGETISKDGHVVSSPYVITGKDGAMAYVSTHSAADAFKVVCDYAGASLVRDAVDIRAVTDAKSGAPTFNEGGNGSTGGIIDNTAAVGGWPEYKNGTVTDTDRDGMSDSFEDEFGLDKKNPSDGKTITLDRNGRYTNLEMYLAWIVRDITAAQVAGATYTK
ncbi:MAG: pectate lyase [Bacteroidales bacterium]|nr:pectate lyase [Bacteroidales bacterium]